MGVLPGPPARRLRRAGAAVSARDDSARCHDAAHRAVLPDWLALYYEQPIEITHGEGRHVWDADGNRYLDFFGGILTTMTAHALPEVTKAVAEQAGRIIHTSTLYLNRPMVELAERIAGALRHPGRAGLLHHLAAPRPTTRRCCWPPRYRRSNQILAMRNSYHGRSFSTVAHHRQPVLVADQPLAAPDAATCTAASAAAARTRELSDARVHRGLRGRPGGHARPDRRRRRRADRRADPGRRRVHLAARRAATPRSARCSTRARHPVDHRRGADRLGPHRRPLLGLAGARRERPARHPHLRQGHRQRHVHRRRRRPRRDHELAWTPTPSRPSAAPRSPWRPGLANLALPAGARPPGQRPAGRRAAHRAAARGRRRARPSYARCAAGA